MIVSGEERRGSGGGCGGCGGCCCGGRGRSYTVVTAGVVVAVVALMLTHSHHLARSHKTGKECGNIVTLRYCGQRYTSGTGMYWP